MIKWIKNLFKKKEEPKIEFPRILGIVRTKAIAVVSNYALTEGKIYDIWYYKYSDPKIIDWYRFTRDDGRPDASHHWRFKLLADWRNEQIDSILND